MLQPIIWASLISCLSLCSAFVIRPPVTPSVAVRLRTDAATRLHSYPAFLPSAEASTIVDPAAIDIMKALQKAPVTVSPQYCKEGKVMTNYARYSSGEKSDITTPILLVHGFDSWCVEYRRLLPALQANNAEAYAMDVLGWGFTERRGVSDFGSLAKRDHLLGFWKDVLGGRPMVLVGASLGGAIAVDFALEYPEAVAKLILIDGQTYIDGSGPGASLPSFLAKIGIQVLGSKPLRMLANKLSYFNKDKFATEDAMLLGRLPVLSEGWAEANLSYMQSGGFTVSKRIQEISCPTLVIWGREDEILAPGLYPDKFLDDLPGLAQLHWVEECGHVPHLEKAEETATVITSFLRTGKVAN